MSWTYADLRLPDLDLQRFTTSKDHLSFMRNNNELPSKVQDNYNMKDTFLDIPCFFGLQKNNKIKVDFKAINTILLVNGKIITIKDMGIVNK